MPRNFLNIGIILLLIVGVTSCYIEQEISVIEKASFEQKGSKWKITVDPDYYNYHGYYDKVSRKRITEIEFTNGDSWKVVERFYKGAQNYYETKHSIPKFKNRKNNNDILYGIYYLMKPDFKDISEKNDEFNQKKDGFPFRSPLTAGDSLFFWYSGLQYSLEFDSTGHFIKSVIQPTSDSPVPDHLCFGQYQLKGDTLELLTFGRKRIRSVVNNKFFYDILLLEPKKEKYLMNTTRDTLFDVRNKLYLPVKVKNTLINLPINKDLSH